MSSLIDADGGEPVRYATLELQRGRVTGAPMVLEWTGQSDSAGDLLLHGPEPSSVRVEFSAGGPFHDDGARGATRDGLGAHPRGRCWHFIGRCDIEWVGHRIADGAIGVFDGDGGSIHAIVLQSFGDAVMIGLCDCRVGVRPVARSNVGGEEMDVVRGRLPEWVVGRIPDVESVGEPCGIFGRQP